MITKSIAAVIIGIVICAPASAQDYAIRLADYTNLRAGPSLNSDILAIAPPEAILEVHGARGHWLQIHYKGGDAWLADWVGFSRIEEEQAVDNCCFLGWPCAGEADWKSGYFGFQNQTCAHPGFVIDGSQTFVAQVRAALDLLRELAPQWYAYADRGL
ncbi:MAG: SH3 domain-containing protein, partial [Anaerolineae bacterium]|nr:SH3 domain-containing protein [Anaerolineae bacterium]